jgi:hypothetical protein
VLNEAAPNRRALARQHMDSSLIRDIVVPVSTIRVPITITIIH